MIFGIDALTDLVKYAIRDVCRRAFEAITDFYVVNHRFVEGMFLQHLVYHAIVELHIA